MKKIIIIEDEIRICELIQRLIDFEGLGLEAAGIANDGITGCSMITELKPDIVITDIRLPGMTGIDILARFFESSEDSGYRPSFIIISGYKEFEYAQKALKYGAEDYLIKPINKEDLNAALGRVLRKIEKAEKLITAVPQKQLPSENALPDFSLPYCCPFIVRLYLSQEQLLLDTKFIRDKIDEIVCRTIPGTVVLGECLYGQHYITPLATASFTEFDQIVAEVGVLIDKALYPYDFVSSEIAIGTIASTDGAQADALNATVFYTAAALPALPAKLLYYKDIPHDITMLPRLRKHALELNLQKAVDELSVRALDEYLDEAEALFREAPENGIAVLSAALWITDRVLSDLRRKYNAIYSFDQVWDLMRASLLCSETTDMILEQLRLRLRSIFGEISSEVKNLGNPTISLVIHFIDEHYAEKISLETIAEKVFLNPVYLSALFKKETGTTVIDYLTGVRMKHAKLLLKDVRNNISQISSEVGYSDPKYFSRLFMKQVGVKPMEYRRLYANSLIREH